MYRGPSRSKDALRMTAGTDKDESRQRQEQRPIRRFWLRQNDELKQATATTTATTTACGAGCVHPTHRRIAMDGAPERVGVGWGSSGFFDCALRASLRMTDSWRG